MIVPESDDVVAARRKKAAALLPRPGATFDMAYFLKNTGPPPPMEPKRERTPVNKKKSLTIFKKRKDVATLQEAKKSDRSLENFVPSERVEQKVTLNGELFLSFRVVGFYIRPLMHNVGAS